MTYERAEAIIYDGIVHKDIKNINEFNTVVKKYSLEEHYDALLTFLKKEAPHFGIDLTPTSTPAPEPVAEETTEDVVETDIDPMRAPPEEKEEYPEHYSDVFNQIDSWISQGFTFQEIKNHLTTHFKGKDLKITLTHLSKMMPKPKPKAPDMKKPKAPDMKPKEVSFEEKQKTILKFLTSFKEFTRPFEVTGFKETNDESEYIFKLSNILFNFKFNKESYDLKSDDVRLSCSFSKARSAHPKIINLELELLNLFMYNNKLFSKKFKFNYSEDEIKKILLSSDGKKYSQKIKDEFLIHITKNNITLSNAMEGVFSGKFKSYLHDRYSGKINSKFLVELITSPHMAHYFEEIASVKKENIEGVPSKNNFQENLKETLKNDDWKKNVVDAEFVEKKEESSIPRTKTYEKSKPSSGASVKSAIVEFLKTQVPASEILESNELFTVLEKLYPSGLRNKLDEEFRGSKYSGIDILKEIRRAFQLIKNSTKHLDKNITMNTSHKNKILTLHFYVGNKTNNEDSFIVVLNFKRGVKQVTLAEETSIFNLFFIEDKQIKLLMEEVFNEDLLVKKLMNVSFEKIYPVLFRKEVFRQVLATMDLNLVKFLPYYKKLSEKHKAKYKTVLESYKNSNRRPIFGAQGIFKTNPAVKDRFVKELFTFLFNDIFLDIFEFIRTPKNIFDGMNGQIRINQIIKYLDSWT